MFKMRAFIREKLWLLLAFNLLSSSCAANPGLKISADFTFAAPQQIEAKAIDFASNIYLKENNCLVLAEKPILL